MVTTIRINANDINENIIASIKSMFKNKEIEINISEAMDDTDYLFASSENRRILEERMKNVDSGKNLITVSVDDLKKELIDND
jgi:antitoxin YefM